MKCISRSWTYRFCWGAVHGGDMFCRNQLDTAHHTVWGVEGSRDSQLGWLGEGRGCYARGYGVLIGRWGTIDHLVRGLRWWWWELREETNTGLHL